MESDLRLKLEIRLESIALVSAAIHLWEVYDAQHRIQNYFIKDYEWDCMSSRQKWNESVEVVYEHIKSLQLGLPNKILTELKHIVGVIQEKIFFWNHYVMVELAMDCKFARKIYWNQQAGIDEDKIFQSFWLNEPDFYSPADQDNILGSSAFNAACLFVQENFIQINLEKMTNEVNKYWEPVDKVYSLSEIIPFWLKSYLEAEWVEQLIGEFYTLMGLVAENGLNRAFKFLAGQMHVQKFKVEEQDFFQRHATESLKAIARNDASRYKKDNFFDIFLFSFNKLTAKRKLTFVLKDIELLGNAILEVWPYQTFLLQILNFIGEIDADKLKNIYPVLLKKIINIKRSCHDPELYKIVDDDILINILQMVPKDQDLIEIYQTLIEKNCASESFNSTFVNQYLNWQDEEKVKEIKFKLGSDDEFICKNTCFLWRSNYSKFGEDGAEDECSKFLSWFYESEELVVDKKRNLINNEKIVKYFWVFSCKNEEKTVDMVDKFLKFCELNLEETKEIRSALIQNINL